MIIFILIFLPLFFSGARFAASNELHEDYMSRESTVCINGIFTVLVFLSHASGYLTLDAALDAPYLRLKAHLSQMVVVTFLFYSGFGMMEQIKKRKIPYVKSILSKRLLKVLLHLNLALVPFFVLQLALGTKYTLGHILLSMIGWKNFGNSNWYIFATMAMYVIVFVSFMLFRARPLPGVLLTAALSVGYVYALMRLKRPSWEYNTVILFSAGMMFSLIKPRFDSIMKKGGEALYFAVFAAALLLYLGAYKLRSRGIELYSIWALMFMACILLITLKVRLNNGVLRWFGSHVFSVYMLQRIPMIILDSLGYSKNTISFVIVSLLFTVCLSALFDLMTACLDRLLFERPKRKIKRAACE